MAPKEPTALSSSPPNGEQPLPNLNSRSAWQEVWIWIPIFRWKYYLRKSTQRKCLITEHTIVRTSSISGKTWLTTKVGTTRPYTIGWMKLPGQRENTKQTQVYPEEPKEQPICFHSDIWIIRELSNGLHSTVSPHAWTWIRRSIPKSISVLICLILPLKTRIRSATGHSRESFSMPCRFLLSSFIRDWRISWITVTWTLWAPW